jgi:uncharacterized protein
MLHTAASTGLQRPPALCTTYEGHDPTYLECVLPLVDYLEVTPDSLARTHNGTVSLDSATMDDIQRICDDKQIVVHGIGLSIGSHEGFSQSYLDLLDSFLVQVPVRWHSEHLGYTRVDGEHLGTMLALPKTKPVLAMICERVATIQERYQLPFLVENIVHVLPDYAGDYSEAGFLNELAERTGCGLLLDVYNLECDAHNQAFDIPGFLSELQLHRVREIHVACGIEYKGFMLDVHSRQLRESTITLAQQVVTAAAGSVEAVTYELLPEAIPILGHNVIAAELTRLRQHLQGV